MACRATSLKAMFCAVNFGAEAMIKALRTRAIWEVIDDAAGCAAVDEMQAAADAEGEKLAPEF